MSQPALYAVPDRAAFSQGEAALFQILLESMEEYAFYMVDFEGRITSWNKGAELHKGYVANEILGRHYRVFFSPEDVLAAVPERALARAKETGRSVCQGWRVHKYGRRIWAEMVVRARRGAKGELQGYAILTRDLSARKAAEDAMRTMDAALREERDQLLEERDRFVAAAESSLDALWMCQAFRDEQGEIVDFVFTYLNSNVEKMVAIPRSELLGRRMCEMLPVNRTSGLFERYKNVLLTGVPLVEEIPLQDRDVVSEWIRIQAVPMRDGIAITASDITSRKLDESRMLHMMQHDPLTGVSNRTVMLERAEQAMKRAKRSGGLMGLLAVDLDEFKQINDTYGHLAGDAVLFTVANRLRTSVRDTDTVVRMGGDEFVVIVSDLNTLDDLSALAARLLSSLQKPISMEGQTIEVTCSIGIAAYPEHSETFEGLLLSADAAMYSAKRSGKNRASVAEDVKVEQE